MSDIGFTGSRIGITDLQKKTIKQILFLFESNSIVHHGDCKGADEAFHSIALEMGFRTAIHAPIDKKLSAFCKADFMYPEKDFIQRNHEIVDYTEVLIVAPDSWVEKLRSGTWATYRYALKQGKPIYIVYPDGEHYKIIDIPQYAVEEG